MLSLSMKYDNFVDDKAPVKLLVRIVRVFVLF